jgi:hypothetical protein
MGTGSFPGVKRSGRDADNPTLLAPRSRESRAIPLLPIWVFYIFWPVHRHVRSPQSDCPDIHCSAICLCLILSCRITTWQSLASADITVSVDPANSSAGFGSEKITAHSYLSRCKFSSRSAVRVASISPSFGGRVLSQCHIAGENFTVNVSTSVYVFVYLGAICEYVQSLVWGYEV